MADLAKFLVPLDCSIHDVIARIDENAQGIALCVDDTHHLKGTVTDGDIRRAILAGVDLCEPIRTLIENKTSTPYPVPLTTRQGATDADLLRIMSESRVRHVPILDEDGRVVDIAILGSLVEDYELPLRAVVMAGGFGTRLRPLTEDCPKPMLAVGDKPLLERTIESLHQAGIRRLHLTTHYKGDVIMGHFADGRKFGMKIRYVKEDQPLGTAGALGLIEASNEPVLVMNGDILTDIDYRAMLNFHREHHAVMTVAVRPYDWQVPYGVVETEGVDVTGFVEKPTLRRFINAGIYLINPEARRHIPKGQTYSMPDLIDRLLQDGKRVVSFPVREYWLDIGQHEDYEQARKDVANWKR